MLDDRASLTDDQPDMKTKILDNMATGRSEFVNAFHAVMTSLMNDIIQTLYVALNFHCNPTKKNSFTIFRGDNEKQDAALETYLSLITAGLEDELFISDYHNSHQIDVQFQTLADFHPHMYPCFHIFHPKEKYF